MNGYVNILLSYILFFQAVVENTRAYEILKQASFLVPFTSRVKIFTVSKILTCSFCFLQLLSPILLQVNITCAFIYQSQLAAARQRNGPHAPYTRNRFRIRRDHIFEDAFNQLSALSEEDLRGMV